MRRVRGNIPVASLLGAVLEVIDSIDLHCNHMITQDA